MLGVTIICEAKLKEKYLRDASDEYVKRLGAYCRLNIIELSPKKLPENPSDSEIANALNAEGKEILSKIPSGAKVFSMCIEGKQLSSERFAREINSCGVLGFSNVIFIIGSSYGLSDEVKKRSDFRLEVTTIAASPRSAGKTYEQAVGDRWKMDTPMPEAVKNIVVMNVNEVEQVASQVDFVFSAVDMTKEEIKKIEEDYAKTETPVVSNNSAHRWTPDVPMVVPEINPQHMEVIKYQKERLGTKRGFVAVKPNCSIQSYAPVLTAWKEFEPYEVVATTYQAISGAGKTFKDWPEMLGNIIPYIGGEEEKSEKEPLRIWGHVDDEKKQIVPATSPVITCQCIRVPVLNGHTAAVFVKFKKKPTKEQLIEALKNYSGVPQELKLPSAPEHFIQYLEEDDRPQVSLDVNFEHGMGISVGRLREDTVYDWKFVGLSHNTVRGAAGGAVLCAELLKAQG